MLFDLKGRRKRLVQVVYVVLAILFGGGLVLFGSGGNVSGGLFDAFSGGGGGGGHQRLQRRGRAARSGARAQPRRSERRWLALVRAQFNLASSPAGSDAETGSLTDRGQQAVIEVTAGVGALREAEAEEDRSEREPQFAALAFGALQDYDKAVDDPGGRRSKTRPSPNAYFQLADFAYRAGRGGAGRPGGQGGRARDSRRTSATRCAR